MCDVEGGEDARPRASRVVNKRRRAKLLASGNHVQLGLRGVHPTRCNSMSSDRGRAARISGARWSAKKDGGAVSEMPRRERRARREAFLHTPSTAGCLPGAAAARPGSTLPLPMIHRRGRDDVTLTEDKAKRDALLSALADPMCGGGLPSPCPRPSFPLLFRESVFFVSRVSLLVMDASLSLILTAPL